MNPLLERVVELVSKHGADCNCGACRPVWSPREAFEAGRLHERARIVVELRSKVLEAERVGLAPIRPSISEAMGGELAEVRGGVATLRALLRDLEGRS
jgi:hypothetical protein